MGALGRRRVGRRARCLIKLNEGRRNTGGEASISSGPVGFFLSRGMLVWADTQSESVDRKPQAVRVPWSKPSLSETYLPPAWKEWALDAL